MVSGTFLWGRQPKPTGAEGGVYYSDDGYHWTPATMPRDHAVAISLRYGRNAVCIQWSLVLKSTDYGVNRPPHNSACANQGVAQIADPMVVWADISTPISRIQGHLSAQ